MDLKTDLSDPKSPRISFRWLLLILKSVSAAEALPFRSRWSFRKSRNRSSKLSGCCTLAGGVRTKEDKLSKLIEAVNWDNEDCSSHTIFCWDIQWRGCQNAWWQNSGPCKKENMMNISDWHTLGVGAKRRGYGRGCCDEPEVYSVLMTMWMGTTLGNRQKNSANDCANFPFFMCDLKSGENIYTRRSWINPMLLLNELFLLQPKRVLWSLAGISFLQLNYVVSRQQIATKWSRFELMIDLTDQSTK